MPLSDEEKDAPDRVVATRKRTEMKTIQSYMVLATLAAVNQSKHFSQVAFAETWRGAFILPLTSSLEKLLICSTQLPRCKKELKRIK